MLRMLHREHWMHRTQINIYFTNEKDMRKKHILFIMLTKFKEGVYEISSTGELSDHISSA